MSLETFIKKTYQRSDGSWLAIDMYGFSHWGCDEFAAIQAANRSINTPLKETAVYARYLVTYANPSWVAANRPRAI